MAATVAGASPPARRSPRNGLPPSWSADEVYAHARAEWNNTDNALKEVPPSSSRVAELPVYVSLCLPLRLPDKPDTPKDLTFQKHRDTHIAQFFASNKAQIPEFYSLFKDCALVTASSAGAERVFSLFSNTFGDQQTRSLEDYIETTLMLQYRVRELTWGRA